MIKLRLFLLLAPLLMLSGGLWAQVANISGTVKEEGGETLTGLTVVIKGTQKGVVTDAKGSFSIQASPKDILIFKFIGYKTQEIVVGSKTTINITMNEDSERMEDLVIVGYGTMRKSDLTGSVATVSGKEINRTSAGSMENLLQGRISGVTVINSSNDNPQGGATVRVRGLSSMNGSNAPLVVVDGVPMGDAGNLNSLNPNIIKSIEVLKDASGTAIYGSRGANGVIQVTTKNGSGVDSNNVWFNGKVGVGKFSKKLDYWRDPVKMAELTNESMENAGSIPLYIGKADPVYGVYYPSVAELRDGSWPYHTDWSDYIFRTSVTQDYNVGLEGSKNDSRYYASLGYYKGEGMQIEDDYDKLTLDVSYLNKVSRTLQFSTKAGLVNGTRNYNYGMDYTRNPIFPVYNGDNSYYKLHSKEYGNPVMMTKEIDHKMKTTDAYFTLKADWDIVENLKFSASGSARGGYSTTTYYAPPVFSYAGDQYNGEGSINKGTHFNYLADAYLTYDKTFSKIHKFTAMVGTSVEENKSHSISTVGQDFPNHVLKEQNISSAKDKFITPKEVRTSMVSAFTRINYILKDRYLFTFTARADGSSKFGKNEKWGYFPSGAFSWRLSEEKFIKNLNFFDQLKFRASYGVSGNQGINPYLSMGLYGESYYFVDGEEIVIRGLGQEIGREGRVNAYATWGGMGNASIGWERTSQLDLGLDISILGGRLDITFDYYNKQTTDLLRQRFLAPNVGIDKVWVNDGEIRNRGVELTIDGRIIAKGDWKLSAGIIFNANRNKVVEFGSPVNSGSIDVNGYRFLPYGASVLEEPYLNVLALGYPMNSFLGYVNNGIIQNKPDNSAKMTQPGEFNYAALGADGSLDPNQRSLIGNPNPKFTGSFSFDLSYKLGFDLSVLFYGVYGNDIFSTRKLYSPKIQAKRWTPDNATNDYPKLRNDRVTYPSTWFVEDGSFLRLQNVTLGYTLPEKLAKKFVHARIYLSVSNPVTFSNVSEYDPEVGENGIGGVPYPKICTFTTGLELKF